MDGTESTEEEHTLLDMTTEGALLPTKDRNMLELDIVDANQNKGRFSLVHSPTLLSLFILYPIKVCAVT